MAFFEERPPSSSGPSPRPDDSAASVEPNGIVKVLAVDDDPAMCKLLRIMLEPRGFKVLEAFSGVKALMVTKRELPDVVLLDIMMPDIDGFDVCRALKLDPATRDVPIIFVTAKAGYEHLERGMSLGAQGYITKPFRPEVLIGKLYEVIGRGTGARRAV
ncbi:MAG: response regulator [Actinobacteria bacterium]|nr:response regulator [Actinomycetota bacterium]